MCPESAELDTFYQIPSCAAGNTLSPILLYIMRQDTKLKQTLKDLVGVPTSYVSFPCLRSEEDLKVV